MKNKRYLYLVCFVIICLGVIASIIFRLSHKPDQYSFKELEKLSISLTPLTVDDFNISLEQEHLSSDPDLIISGIFTGDREFQNGVSLSKIKFKRYI